MNTKKELFEYLGAFKKVRNMRTRNGSSSPNQFILEFEHGVVFQSYKSIIAVVTDKNEIYLGTDWNYSRTTSRYRNWFLDKGTDEIKSGILAGKIKLLEI